MFAPRDILKAKPDELLRYIQGVKTYFDDFLVLSMEILSKKLY